MIIKKIKCLSLIFIKKLILNINSINYYLLGLAYDALIVACTNAIVSPLLIYLNPWAA